ncbi:MAG: hypothetical protein PVS2B3_05090 [Steroidobacteraceae bacterium]
MSIVPRASALVAACTALVMTACGQKGPLYLPDKAAAVVTIPPVTAAPAPASGPAATPAAAPGKLKDKSATPGP